MIPCPSCHQPVEILDQHMGTLFTCPHCNSVYFIDWNGQPELAVHESEVQPVPEFMAPVSSEVSQNINSQNINSKDENDSYFEAPVSEEAYGFSDSNAESFEADLPSEYHSLATETHHNYSEEAPYDFNQPLDQMTIGPSESENSLDKAPADFSDVTEFANSNSSSGPFSYTVIISGVESSHLVKQLREAMTDSKFGWDTESILSKIGGGSLILPGLSPTKASVLINRIKYLPLKISWRQDVLSSS
ncbi:MAG: hypothetical protein ACXVCY_13260 [Pseudobdellovibrionaceae bacterium]